MKLRFLAILLATAAAGCATTDNPTRIENDFRAIVKEANSKVFPAVVLSLIHI